LTLTNEAGQRRIDDPHDWTRRELVEAFTHKLRVIPVLTDGVTLPAETELPDDIAGLSRRQYVPLRRRYTAVDLAFIVKRIAEADPALDKAAAQHQPSAAPEFPGPARPMVAPARQAPTALRLPPRYIHGVALPANWADRTQEAIQLGQLIRRRDTRVLNIVAMGGTGKTALMRKIADDLATVPDSFDSLIWFSFYRDSDVERFFLEACRYLVPAFDPSAYASTFERTALLQTAIEARSTLFVLDGFERLIVGGAGQAEIGRINRREITSFFEFVLSGSSESTVVLTSRLRLDEFSGVAGYFELELPHLRLDSAVGYLRAGGVGGSDRALRRVTSAYGCHALALTVFLDYVRYRRLAGDISQVDAPLTFPRESTRADRLSRLLAHYDSHLSDGERRVLNWISSSPRGLEADELHRLLTEASPGKTTSTGPDAQRILRSLGVSTLATPHKDGTTVLFDSHPLIKGFFYERLAPAERAQLHGQLMAMARTKHVVEEPSAVDEIQPLLDVFWHATAMGDLSTAFAAWRDPRVYRRLLWWGNYQVALELVDQMLVAPPLRAEPQAPMKGLLLDEAGILLVKVGKPLDALDAYRDSVNYLRDDPGRLLQALLNYSEAQMEVGLYLDARGTLMQAEALIDKIPEFPRFKLLGRRGYLAAALDSFEFAEALLTEALREAVAEQRGAPPGYQCLFLRIRGDLYCSAGRLSLGEKDYQAALELAVDPRWRFVDYEGHIRRGLGDLASLRAQPSAAMTHFAAALDVARRIGYLWLEAETFAAMARSALHMGNIDSAQHNADRAQTLAKTGGWLAIEAGCLLVKAVTAGRRGEPGTADLDAARVLITRSGHRALQAEYSAIAGETV
jgi:tetratricopeptide (TPR) repeat protein